MRLKKTELAAIAVTLLFAAVTVGFRLGRRSVPAAFSVRAAETVTTAAERAPSASSATAEPTAPAVNINTADLEELCTLNGIGETLAQRIIDYRELHGPFTCVEDITKVSGIGSGLLERLQDRLTIGQP